MSCTSRNISASASKMSNTPVSPRLCRSSSMSAGVISLNCGFCRDTGRFRRCACFSEMSMLRVRPLMISETSMPRSRAKSNCRRVGSSLACRVPRWACRWSIRTLISVTETSCGTAIPNRAANCRWASVAIRRWRPADETSSVRRIPVSQSQQVVHSSCSGTGTGTKHAGQVIRRGIGRGLTSGTICCRSI